MGHIYNSKPGRKIVLALVAAGLFLVTPNLQSAKAALAPEIQAEVDQIIAAGGDEVNYRIWLLARHNAISFNDVITAACLQMTEEDCISLNAYLRAKNDDRGFVLELILFGGARTSENPGQTSGSEANGGR